MTDVFLTLNTGSSSIKFAVFEAAKPGSAPRISGKFAGVGRAPVFIAHDSTGTLLSAQKCENLEATDSHEDLVALLLEWLVKDMGIRRLVAVGHRVVHGGRNFGNPVLIDEKVIAELEALVRLAPLHQPHSLAAIRAVRVWNPDAAQIACFDTGFHRTQDNVAKVFALPRHLTEEGIIRYGFHGISYEYIAKVLPEHIGARANGRVVVAHLGNGASLCAMKERKSVATSMGFTALDGLMMGRRCGTLDPGVVLYLAQSRGMTPTEIETLLYKESGLLGVSGISNNMQVLEESDAPSAREAIDLFVYRAATTLAGLLPAVGGLDTIVFTAGIGENAADVRKGICDRLSWLGLELDDQANSQNAVTISADTSAVEVLVLPTNEEAIIAAACESICGDGKV